MPPFIPPGSSRVSVIAASHAEPTHHPPADRSAFCLFSCSGRYLANKCSICARIDCFSELPSTVFGEKMKEQVEERLQFYDSGMAAASLYCHHLHASLPMQALPTAALISSCFFLEERSP